MQSLVDLLARLHAQNVDFVLVGGFAAVMHGGTLVTRDLDICCRFDEENLRRIQAAVTDLHPTFRSRPNVPLELTPELCATLKNLYLRTDLGILDCLGEVAGVGGFAEVYQHSITVELPFGTCRVLDLETLIRAKQAMNREHDKITVVQLQAVRNRQNNP